MKADAGGREFFSGFHFEMDGRRKSGRGLPQSKT
jgi:hypothetical protein